MRILIAFLMLAISVGFAFGQQLYTGIHADNYLGYASIHAQPASISGSLAKLSITASGALFKTTNYKAQNLNNLLGYRRNQSLKYREHKIGGYQHANTSLDILGVKYEFNHKFAMAYGIRMRFFSIREGLPEEWAQNDATEYKDNVSSITPFDYDRLSMQRFRYLEHALTFGGVLVEKRENFLKAGISLKLINGITAGYLFGESGSMQFNNTVGPNASLLSGDMQFGVANDSFELDQRKLGFGTSIGMVYEFRPNPKQYKYDMDGETDIIRYDLPKYKWRFGIALTDIGRVKFTKDSTSHDFANDTTSIEANQYTSLLLNPISYTNQSVVPNATRLAGDSTWSMNLPASLSLQFDYKVTEKIYANYSTAIPLHFKKDPHGVYQKMIHTLTPRYETSLLGIALPLSFQTNGQFNLGAAVRFQKKGATIFAGSNNISFVFGKRSIYNVSAFGGVAFNILYKVPKDTDKDKVSDMIDECIYDPGPLSLKGCPDTDNDSIPDKEDNCIYDKGTKKYRGCPDTDGDGIIDLNDQCPDDAGLAVHYGCPDRDRDGVIDVADRCPDVPGIELNNGCPFENKGCCSDNDGDGISNEVDECPDVQGSVYNHGCPIDSSNIDKIPFQHEKQLLDPNNTIEKVDEIVDVKRDANMILNDKEIAEAEKRMEMYSLNIYFKFDDATIPVSSQTELTDMINSMAKSNKNSEFVIIGHTDREGSDTYNLILSRKRAEVVRRTLVNRGIPDNRIKVYYYGEWKPLKSNENERGRQFNRRVEIRVMK